MLLAIMPEQEEDNKLNKEPEYLWDNDKNNKPFLKKRIIPSDLNDIQPRATQVWKCDEIGFDTNRRWNKVIFNYKFFQTDYMKKVQTGDRSPCWCT